jgi:hypothetical protein
MMYRSGSIVILIIMVCVLTVRFGRQRRQSGRPVTPRDIVLVMAVNWALGWFWLGLPSLVDWGRHMPWSEVVKGALLLFGLAIAPLVLVLTATWLPRLFAVPDHADKKPAAPHLLD